MHIKVIVLEMFGGLFLDFRLKKRECLFEIIDKDNITF